MSTNACYSRFECFLNQRQEKTFFPCGREKVSIHVFLIYCTTMVKFDTKFLHVLLIH